MISEIQGLVDGYAAWLRDKTVLREVRDWVEITTPYLDRHNDYLQIYARRENGGYILTDDGYTIEDLEHSGCRLDSPKRQELLQLTLNGFGVHHENGVLSIRASSDDFAARKHSLLQAMLAINDLFYLAEPLVANLFHEDVAAWLDTHGVRYVARAKFAGKSGYDHLFDFVIPPSRTHPERVVREVNRPSKQQAHLVTYAWLDTREVRPASSHAYVLLNDSHGAVSDAITTALRNYGITPVLWTSREEVLPDLVA